LRKASQALMARLEASLREAAQHNAQVDDNSARKASARIAEAYVRRLVQRFQGMRRRRRLRKRHSAFQAHGRFQPRVIFLHDDHEILRPRLVIQCGEMRTAMLEVARPLAAL
jgi:septal ring factor EnvC (AmiA/AmiB activator)